MTMPSRQIAKSPKAAAQLGKSASPADLAAFEQAAAQRALALLQGIR
jgi:hypothetical protein